MRRWSRLARSIAVIGFWRAMYDAAPKSLEIPRAVAALRELIACADWAQELDAVDDVPNDIDIGACGTRFSAAWAAARSALAMYDQERG